MLALKAQLVVLVGAFVMISTVWSVSCLLFFYSRCPRVQPFVKVACPLCLWSRRHWGGEEIGQVWSFCQSLPHTLISKRPSDFFERCLTDTFMGLGSLQNIPTENGTNFLLPLGIYFFFLFPLPHPPPHRAPL